MHLLAMFLQDNPNQPNPEMIQNMVVAMMAIIPILIVIGIAVVMIPCWFILKKAGFSPWLCLLVPDSVAGDAGTAVCAGVCRVEGRARAAGCWIPQRHIPSAATLSAAGVRWLT